MTKNYMKISELIEKLNEIKSSEGDLVCAVECRDGGGSYNEYTNIFLEVNDLDDSTSFTSYGVNESLQKDGFKKMLVF